MRKRLLHLSDFAAVQELTRLSIRKKRTGDDDGRAGRTDGEHNDANDDGTDGERTGRAGQGRRLRWRGYGRRVATTADGRRRQTDDSSTYKFINAICYYFMMMFVFICFLFYFKVQFVLKSFVISLLQMEMLNIADLIVVDD